MSGPVLRRTIRRCTALLLVVLGAIAVDVSTIDYSGLGGPVGGLAVVGGGLYLAGSCFVQVIPPAAPGTESGDGDRGSGDGGRRDGDDGSDGDGDDGSDETESTADGPNPDPVPGAHDRHW